MERDEPKFPRLPPEIIEMIFKQLPWNAVTILWKTSKELQNLLTEVTQEIICTEQGEIIFDDVDILLMLDNIHIVHPVINIDDIDIITTLMDKLDSLYIVTDTYLDELDDMGFVCIVYIIVRRVYNIYNKYTAFTIRGNNFMVEQIGDAIGITTDTGIMGIRSIWDMFPHISRLYRVSAIENIILNVPRIYIEHESTSLLEFIQSQAGINISRFTKIEEIYVTGSLKGHEIVFDFPNIRRVFAKFGFHQRFLPTESVEWMTIDLTDYGGDEISTVINTLESEFTNGELNYRPIVIVGDIKLPETELQVITDTEFDRLVSFDMEFERQSIEHLKRVCS